MATRADPRACAKAIDELKARIESGEFGGEGGGIPPGLEDRIAACEAASSDVSKGRAGKLAQRIEAAEARIADLEAKLGVTPN